MTPATVTVRAPAKVNLQLSVGPVGADGYHPLATVFHAVSLCDEVRVRAGSAGAGIELTAVGDDTGEVPLGPTNLAARAASALAAELGVAPDVRITLGKAIPVAGGMAGGSADAAATLVACAELWGVEPGDPVLPTIAAGLGADVPFGLIGGTAIGLGRGDELTAVPTEGRFDWVFATSYEGLSTPAVYRRFDELAAGRTVPEPCIDQRLLDALAAGDAGSLGDLLSNDLQPAAIDLQPSLRDVLDAGLAAGALGALVSGSGPTVAFLVDGDTAAMSLVTALTPTRLVRSLRRAYGPVPGARVVAT